jgi:hypothetical protein
LALPPTLPTATLKDYSLIPISQIKKLRLR